MVIGAPPVGWEADEGFDDVPGLPDVIRRAMARHPQNRYADAAAMRAALDWLEVESAKQNPRTQDIPPWMETSNIGSIPVPSLNSPLPPALATSSHPPGKVLSTSGARPIPIKPVRVDEAPLRPNASLASNHPALDPTRQPPVCGLLVGRAAQLERPHAPLGPRPRRRAWRVADPSPNERTKS